MDLYVAMLSIAELDNALVIRCVKDRKAFGMVLVVIPRTAFWDKHGNDLALCLAVLTTRQRLT
jgi:hypothetical protein